MKPGIGAVLRDAWRLALPYFRSEERWSARLLLASIIVLNLVIVWINVQLNTWQGAFFNSIQNKDGTAFQSLLLFGHSGEDGYMPGFTLLAAAYVLIAIYRTYLRQWLQIRWRAWMTGRLLADWLSDRAYYTIGLQQGPGATDNPDQRIAEDMRSFTDDTLRLGLELLSQVVTLISFAQILWVLSGTVTLLGVPIPGYMVFVAIVYAIVGTVLTHLIGKPLASIEFQRQKVEAEFRFALVRVRENAEGVALHAGEASEEYGLRARFAAIIGNVLSLMNRQKKVNALDRRLQSGRCDLPVRGCRPPLLLGRHHLRRPDPDRRRLRDRAGCVVLVRQLLRRVGGLARHRRSLDRIPQCDRHGAVSGGGRRARPPGRNRRRAARRDAGPAGRSGAADRG